MTDLTQIFSEIDSGDPSKAEELLPILYAELRKLAEARLAREEPGNSLQATALVHEAYLKLTRGKDQHWNSRGHFFGAAAEAMRRILVDQARRKMSIKAGGGRRQLALSVVDPESPKQEVDLIALDEALEILEEEDSRSCAIVKLRYFAGLTVPDVAKAMKISISTVESDWAYARAWLKQRLRDET